MNETLLTDLVLQWGDALMKNITETLYSSALINLVIYLVFVFVFVMMGRAFANGQDFLHYGRYFIAWMLIFPVEQKPVFYHIVNTGSVAISHLMQRAMYSALTVGNTKKVLPPGFVFNSIIKAANSDVTDPNIRANIRILVENCIPAAKNRQGQPFSALDLFGGKVIADPSGSDTITLDFDTALLQNRGVYAANGQDTNCYDLLIQTRRQTRSHMRAKDLTGMQPQVYVGANTGDTDPGAYVTTWDDSAPQAIRMRNIALNLSEAQAYQKTILKDFFSFPENMSDWGKKEEGQGTMSPMTSLSSYAFNDRISFFGADFDPTRIVTEVANAPRALARSMGLEGALDAGFTLHEMNESLIALPLKISTIQMYLKLVAPLIILLLLIPRAGGIVVAWSIGWFVSLLTPVILMFTRSIANQILIWASKLDTVLPMVSGHPALLNAGVDFEAANAIMRDAGLWLSTFLEIEKYIWTGLFMALPIAGGALAATKGHSFLKRVGERAGDTVVRSTTQTVIRGASHTAKAVGGGFVAPFVVASGAVASAAASSSFNRMLGQRNQGNQQKT